VWPGSGGSGRVRFGAPARGWKWQAWDLLKKRLRLIMPDGPERAGPADPSYAYGGYAPVSLRVIAAATPRPQLGLDRPFA